MSLQEKYKLKKEQNHLEIILSGEFNRKIQDDLLTDAPKLAKELNYSKLLVDLRNTTINLSVQDHYQGGKDFVENFLGNKVAFVFAAVLANYTFGEMVALNRGGILALFTSISEAREWLFVS